MTPREERRLRADAERNRRRLLEAAAEVFRERGLDAGVAEIAERAGVGRGTLFRNFPCKEDLVAAIVVERMNEAAARGRGLIGTADPGAALFGFLDEIAGRQRLDRGLFEAVAETFLANQDLRAAHTEVMAVLDELLTGAQRAGVVRPDVETGDVLMLLKGVCEAAGAFSRLDPNVVGRQLDLVRSALSAPGELQPLRGRPLTLEDFEHGAQAAVRPAAAGSS